MDFGSVHADIFAVLLPITEPARETVALNHNARLSERASNILLPSHFIAEQFKDQRLIKLPFAAIRGRRCFTFGSSRYKDYHLPKSDDISRLHFVLSFNSSCGSLHIRNASSYGTWISEGPSNSTLTKCADEAPQRAFPVTRICLGYDQRLEFLLILNLPSIAGAFHEHLARYFHSIGRMSPVSASTSPRKRCATDVHESTKVAAKPRKRLCTMIQGNARI
jgi:hypothetical protein